MYTYFISTNIWFPSPFTIMHIVPMYNAVQKISDSMQYKRYQIQIDLAKINNFQNQIIN